MDTMPRYPNVVITGGAGYVGSALAPYLLSLGYRVTVLDLFWYGREVFHQSRYHPRLHLCEADIRDEQAVAAALGDAQTVIHLACISNDPSFELDPALGTSINYDAFRGLLRAVRAANIRRFIYASSSSVYGLNDAPAVTEDTPCQPLTDYSRYKLLCEEALKNEGAGDCDWVIARPATVCGYAPRLRLDLTVNLLTMHALCKRQITVFGGEQLRPNLNMRDMVAAYRVLVEAPREAIHGQTFNIGYQNQSVRALAELVAAQLNDPELTIVTQPTDDLRSYHINSDRMRARLGFAPRWTIEQAVDSLVQAYRAGWLSEPLTNPRYHNTRMMQTLQPRTLQEQRSG